jgi:predicted dehydrogenase
MAGEHIRALSDVPGTTVVGIFSRTRSKADSLAETFGIKVVAQSVAELYERTQADLVVVAVSEISMREVSLECFQFPWVVLLEKPPGYMLREARAIQREALVGNRKVFVALNRRFYSTTQTALADLAGQEGRRYVHVQDQQSQEQVTSLGYPKTVIEHLMYANSIHLVDYFTVYCRGAVKSVNRVSRWNAADPGVVVAFIEFESGDQGLYEGLWQGPGPWAVSVTTPAIRWELRPLEQVFFQRWGERQRHGVECSAWDLNFKPGLRMQAQEIVAAALGEKSRSVTLDEAVKTMELVAAIYESQ